MKAAIQTPKSRFVRILCKKCKNKQIVYNKAATVVRCLKCNEELSNPKGGEAHIKGKLIQTLS